MPQDSEQHVELNAEPLRAALESQLGLIESAILPLAKFVYREADDDKKRDAQLDELMRKLDAMRGAAVPEGE